MYLMLNKDIKCGEKISKKDIKDNLFVRLNLKDFYYKKLVSSYSSSCIISPTGNVECELLDDFDYVLDLYDFVYEVVQDDESFVVKKRFNDSEYIELVVDLIVASGAKKGCLYSITEVLKKKSIKKEKDFSYVLDGVKNIMKNLDDNEYGFVYLLKTLEQVIPDTYPKKKYYMGFLCDCLIEKIEGVNTLGLITEEEKIFLNEFLNMYSKKEWNIDALKNFNVVEMPF